MWRLTVTVDSGGGVRGLDPVRSQAAKGPAGDPELFGWPALVQPPDQAPEKHLVESQLA